MNEMNAIEEHTFHSVKIEEFICYSCSNLFTYSNKGRAITYSMGIKSNRDSKQDFIIMVDKQIHPSKHSCISYSNGLICNGYLKRFLIQL